MFRITHLPRRWVRIMVLLGAVGALASLLAAADAASVAAQTGQGILALRAVDARTGGALAGAAVSVTDKNGQRVAGGSTDAQGNYRLQLPPQDYQVGVTSQGYGRFAKIARIRNRRTTRVRAALRQNAPAPPPSGSCSGVPAYAEIRPENAAANRTAGTPLDPAHRNRVTGFGPYYDQVNGRGCTGTTEQILEWAARKWRFHEIGYADIAKAMAVEESAWRQSKQGDCGSGACESFGILQVRLTQWWGGNAAVKASTAMNADYSMAILRHHYDGRSWLGSASAGIRNAIGAYFCGCGNAGSSSYTNRVLEHLRNKPWKTPGQPPYYF